MGYSDFEKGLEGLPLGGRDLKDQKAPTLQEEPFRQREVPGQSSEVGRKLVCCVPRVRLSGAWDKVREICRVRKGRTFMS